MCCTVGSENLPPFKRQHLDLQVMHFTVSGGPYLRPKRVGNKWRGWAHNFHHHFRIVSILWSVDKIKSHFVGGQKFNRTIFHLFCSINSCVFCTKIYQCILRFAYTCHLVELHTQWHDGLLVTLQPKKKITRRKMARLKPQLEPSFSLLFARRWNALLLLILSRKSICNL